MIKELKQSSYRHIQSGIIAALLLVLSAFLGRINDPQVLSPFLFVFTGIVRSGIQTGLLAVWGFSVRRRVLAKAPRRILTASALLLVLWILLKTAKYYFCEDPDLDRILWYLYYVPLIFSALFALYTALSLGQSESWRLPVRMLSFAAVSTLLVLIILTNDIHQFVFRFPEGAAVFTDEDYTYGPGYYITVAWVLICSVSAIIVMIRKCRRPLGTGILWLPFIPVGFALVYAFLYAVKSPVILNYIPDLSVVMCLTIAACFESFTASGLIQSNTHYRELFEASGIPVYITDRGFNVFLRSRNAAVPDVSVLKSAVSEPVMTGDGNSLSAAAINGGYVFWETDVSGIARSLEELSDINESLREKHMLALEELRTEREKDRLQEANRLYYSMQKETAPQLGRMQALAKILAICTDKEEERNVTGEMAMIGAYFKRRNNLFFLSESSGLDQNISSLELEYCIRESLQTLDLAGIKESYLLETDEEIKLIDIINIYDAFQKALESSMEGLQSVAVTVRGNASSGYSLDFSLQQEASTEFNVPEGFEAEDEGDGSRCLSIFIEPEGGDAND